jgi:hypothetical protein
MKSGFKDPIAPKINPKTKKSPWDYRQPPYDERSSCYVDAGSHYGVGHKQPVGREGAPKTKAEVLPFGRINTMKTDEAPRKMLEQEYIE